MAITSIISLSDITATKAVSSTISDKINDEIIPKIDKVSGTVNEINWKLSEDIKPSINNNKNNINEIKCIVKDEILPITTDFIELYEIIIIRILLSRLMIFLNHIFHWYSYMIQAVDDNPEGIIHIIVLSEFNHKNTYKVRRKEFKDKLKELKKEYRISYNDLVDRTIYYTKTILRNK